LTTKTLNFDTQQNNDRKKLTLKNYKHMTQSFITIYTLGIHYIGTLGKIMGRFCMFPEIFQEDFVCFPKYSFFSQNGRIIRPFGEKNGKIWETYNIFPKFSHDFSQ